MHKVMFKYKQESEAQCATVKGTQQKKKDDLMFDLCYRYIVVGSRLCVFVRIFVGNLKTIRSN